MHHISINNLFSTDKNNFRPLDVYSLCNTKESRKPNRFNKERLINLRQQRKNRVLKEYEKFYNICLTKINTANNINRTDIEYEIPAGLFGYVDYDPSECLKYMESKLQSIDLDTMITSNNTIYISWHNLGEKSRSKYK